MINIKKIFEKARTYKQGSKIRADELIKIKNIIKKLKKFGLSTEGLGGLTKQIRFQEE